MVVVVAEVVPIDFMLILSLRITIYDMMDCTAGPSLNPHIYYLL